MYSVEEKTIFFKIPGKAVTQDFLNISLSQNSDGIFHLSYIVGLQAGFFCTMEKETWKPGKRFLKLNSKRTLHSTKSQPASDGYAFFQCTPETLEPERLVGKFLLTTLTILWQ